MFPQHLPVRAPAGLQWPLPSAEGLDSLCRLTWDPSRHLWTAAFVARLAELRPLDDEDVLVAIASDLWPDVGNHDPMIAAEMEYEASSGLD